jgi:ribosomal-protein-alanine N-acetyltransferase
MAILDSPPMQFSPLTLMHIPHVLHIEQEAYPEPWSFNMLRQEISNENGYFCLIHSEEQLMGYGGFWMLLDEAHITRVTIIAPLRGRGFSKVLMNHLLEKARERDAKFVRLEVRESNTPAIRLYSGLGFSSEGRRIGYYQRTNENALLMSRPLCPFPKREASLP